MSKNHKRDLIIIWSAVALAALFTWYMYERWTAPIYIENEVQNAR